MITKVFGLDELPEAGNLVRMGGLVAFPTETVYGLGGNALDPQAAQAIYAAKGRPSDNPLIVHIASQEQLTSVARSIDPLSQVLADTFWPGPLTLILPKHPQIPYETTGSLDTVGIRIPDDPVALEFLTYAQVPVAAPSANLSGRPSPTSFWMVKCDLDGRIHGIVQGTDTRIGLESTILWVAGNHIHILRPGTLGEADIYQALRTKGYTDIQVIVPVHQNSNRMAEVGEVNQRKNDSKYPTIISPIPQAPGTRYRHYSPQAMVIAFKDVEELLGDHKYLAFLTDNATGIVTLEEPPPLVTQLESHLKVPVVLIESSGRSFLEPKEEGLEDQKKPIAQHGPDPQPESLLQPRLYQKVSPGIFLLPFSSITHYAQQLYKTLVKFDELGVQVIFLQLPPGLSSKDTSDLAKSSQGLTKALTDRIFRAAGLA